MTPFKKILFSSLVLSVGLLTINAAYKGEPKDALDKRTFKVSMTEVKTGAASKKGVDDEIEFKGGKIFSGFLFDKFEFSRMKYEITKDSTFTDEEENEMHIIEAEASTTDATDQTVVITCKVEDADISGEVKITKKDKLKKRYEFSGKEKDKKKK
jgi:hypothetical protein